MAENKREGPAGDRKRENLEKFPKFREKIKKLETNYSSEEKNWKSKSQNKVPKKKLLKVAA